MAPEVLTTIANAARDHERLRFDYTGHDGSSTLRDVEPHRLVHRRGRWYLVGYDIERRTGGRSGSTASGRDTGHGARGSRPASCPATATWPRTWRRA